jgi:hypothetical protein
MTSRPGRKKRSARVAHLRKITDDDAAAHRPEQIE